MRIVLVVFAGMAVVTEHGQQGQWAAADNTTAKFMVDAERQWAEAACTHNKITDKILANDFQGTSPDGKRYTKIGRSSGRLGFVQDRPGLPVDRREGSFVR